VVSEPDALRVLPEIDSYSSSKGVVYLFVATIAETTPVVGLASRLQRPVKYSLHVFSFPFLDLVVASLSLTRKHKI